MERPLVERHRVKRYTVERPLVECAHVERPCVKRPSRGASPRDGASLPWSVPPVERHLPFQPRKLDRASVCERYLGALSFGRVVP